MKIKPRYNYQIKRRWRKRDGVLDCDSPDAGYPFDRTKRICLNCHKVWRRAHGEHTVCPHCGNALTPVHPFARIPRRRNKRAWKRIEERYNT